MLSFISEGAVGSLTAIPFVKGLEGAQAPSLIVSDLVLLIAQLLTDLTVTNPFIVVDGYETLMLVVPCPDNNVASAGTAHNKDVACAGNDAIV